MRTNRDRSNTGRLVAVGFVNFFLIGFLIGGLALTMQPAVSAAQRSKKDKDQDVAQTGAQCSPGTGAPSGAGAAAAAPASMPVDDIIRQFAQHESDFKLARDNYTYSQEVLVEDVAPNHGEYRLTSDIVFTPAGKRFEQVTF